MERGRIAAGSAGVTLALLACAEAYDAAPPPTAAVDAAVPDVASPSSLDAQITEASAKRCSDDAPFEAIEPLASLNTAGEKEWFVRLSEDERTIVFSRGQLFISTRASIADPFPEPRRLRELEAPIEKGGFLADPVLSPDSLTIYYTVAPETTTADIWSATRLSALGPFGMTAPVANINSSGNESHPFIHPLGLWFRSERADRGFYFAERYPNGLFNAPIFLPEFESSDGRPTVSADGLTMYFARVVAPRVSIFVATRANTIAAFGNVRLLAGPVNGEGDNEPGMISFDHCRLYFHRVAATPPIETANADLFVARRIPPP